MKCLKTSHLRYSGVPCFTTIAKDGKYSCFVDSDLGVGPDVPVVPDRVQAIKSTGGFLETGS